MKIYLVLFCLLLYFEKATLKNSSELTDGKKTKIIPFVDALISRLEQEQWSDDEPCLRGTLDMLWGVKNRTLWATWAWDSMSSPIGTMYGVDIHFGNYDQCLQAPWSSEDHSGSPGLRMQYCLVDVKTEAVEEHREFGAFDDADEYFSTPTKYRRRFNELVFGTCLPAICSPSSVGTIYHHFHLLTHLPDGEVFVDPRDCQKAGEVTEYSWGFYMFWTFVGALFATTILSTLYSYNANDGTKSMVLVIRNSFNMKRNYNSIFTVNRSEIKVMNGIRAITAIIVVFIHECFYTMLSPIANGLEMNKEMTSSFGQAMSHIELVVDTFLAMSGLLLMRSLMMQKQTNLLRRLMKRYFRLIGPLVFCTLYLSTSAVMYMDHGPFWARANREETDICEKNWWRNILMVNTEISTLCHIVSWYVSCDFQLAVLATFLFYLFRKNRRLGIAAFILVAAGVTLNIGYVVYSKKLMTVVPFHFEILKQYRNNTTLNDTYFTSHVRAGPYLVGMIMGYIIASYKPDEHRNVISKKWSVIIIAASLTTMNVMLWIDAFFAGRPYDPLEVAVVVATNRVFWSIGVCGIIGVCEYGTVPLITDFLSWSGFVPLSKLSYCLYLLHTLIMQKQSYPARNPVMYKVLPMAISATGVTVIGYAASLILYLILEAPLHNLYGALTDRTASTKTTQSGFVKQTNGIKIEKTL